MLSFKNVVCDKLPDISSVKNKFSFLGEKKYLIAISMVAILLVGTSAIYSHFKVSVAEDTSVLAVTPLSLTAASSATGKISIPATKSATA